MKLEKTLYISKYPYAEIVGIIREPGKDVFLRVRNKDGISARMVREDKHGTYIMNGHDKIYLCDLRKVG